MGKLWNNILNSLFILILNLIYIWLLNIKMFKYEMHFELFR
jgi:hypothetical protein